MKYITISKSGLLKKIATVIAVVTVSGFTTYIPVQNSFNTGIVAEAYSSGNYKVNTADGVNVRKGAGTGYSKLGAAANGTSFTVDNISGNWGHTNSIKCTNGTKSGWICLDYCTKTADSDSRSNSSLFLKGTYKVDNCSKLNIRTGPGTDYSSKGTVKNGTYLYITSKSGKWGYAKNKSGYVSMSYCKFVSPFDLTKVDSGDSGDSAKSYSTSLTNGKAYFISPACATGCNVDAAGGKKDNGTNVQIWTKNSKKNQQFKAVYLSNGYYAFYDVNSGKVLDVSGGVAKNSQNVQLYKYNGTASQLWRIFDAGDGYYYIQSKLNSNYCLDVSGGTNKSGTNIQIYKSNSSKAQKFKFTSVVKEDVKLGISSYSKEYKNGAYYTKLVNSKRTGANRATVANIALSQVGYQGGSYSGETYAANYKNEYNRWYYNSDYYNSKYHWCAVFVNWCMRQANVPNSVYPCSYSKSGIYAEGVYRVRDWYKDRSRYKGYSSYTPKVGDVAIFTWSHIGIVVDVSGSGKNAKVTVVEGNCSNRVQKNTYINNGGKLAGYCVPSY